MSGMIGDDEPILNGQPLEGKPALTIQISQPHLRNGEYNYSRAIILQDADGKPVTKIDAWVIEVVGVAHQMIEAVEEQLKVAGLALYLQEARKRKKAEMVAREKFATPENIVDAKFGGN